MSGSMSSNANNNTIVNAEDNDRHPLSPSEGERETDSPAKRMKYAKKEWTPEEDIKLVSCIQEHGAGNWKDVPKKTGLLHKTGKSCRFRWANHLRPGIKRGDFTPKEDNIIIRHQALTGNRWAAIAARLPGRTNNDVKNYWNTYLKKKDGIVDTSGDDRTMDTKGDKDYGDVATIGGLDYIKAFYDKMYKKAMAGNSITSPPQNQPSTPQNQPSTSQNQPSTYEDIGIPTLEEIDRLLLNDPTL